MLDLVKLKMFQIVAIRQSFTRAAQELGYSQSNVTTAIKALEHELGAQLFDRIRFSKKVVLTEVGRRALQYADRLLALAEETRVAIHKEAEPSGPLKVSAPESLLTYRLPGLLHRFQVLYPHVELGITSGASSGTLINEIMEGVTDLAFVVDQPLHSSRLLVGSLIKEELVLVMAPDHDFASNGTVKCEDLAQVRVLLPDNGSAIRALLEARLSATGLKLEFPLELGSLEAVKQCAMAGMGIAILPKVAVAEELEQRLLVRLNWVGPELAVYTQIVRSSERWTSPAVLELWSLAQHTLSSGSTPKQ
jgi:DNA-binding transcriptional LysR family regulator